MTQPAAIRLRWLPGVQPQGPRIVRPARFDTQGEDWTDRAWSLVIELEGAPDDLGRQFGTARFLVQEAPASWLAQGHRFTLYDGGTALAEAEVTSAWQAAAQVHRRQASTANG